VRNGKPLCSQLPQLVVNQREELIGRMDIAVFNGGEVLGDMAHGAAPERTTFWESRRCDCNSQSAGRHLWRGEAACLLLSLALEVEQAVSVLPILPTFPGHAVPQPSQASIMWPLSARHSRHHHGYLADAIRTAVDSQAEPIGVGVNFDRPIAPARPSC
jgi:hypothetical protein